MKCPNCSNDNWDVYETDGDGMSNDYIEHVVCNECEAEYSIRYECRIVEVIKNN